MHDPARWRCWVSIPPTCCTPGFGIKAERRGSLRSFQSFRSKQVDEREKERDVFWNGNLEMFPFHLCNHPGKLNIGCQHQSLAVSVWTAAFRRESFPLHEYHEFHLHLLRRVEPFLGVHCSAAYSLFLSFFLSFFLSLSLNFVFFCFDPWNLPFDSCFLLLCCWMDA